MHNIWCATLDQTVSFPQPDSILRLPAAKEYEKYGHKKPLSAPKWVKKHTPNLVVYSDVSEDDTVSTDPSVGVDEVTVPYDDPTLDRIRVRSYPAADAGSATQTVTDVVVMRR